MRRILASTCLALVVASCGGGDEASLANYTESVRTVVDRAAEDYRSLVASPEGAVLVAGPDEIDAFTPQDLQHAFDHVRQIEAEVEEAISVIVPPAEVAEIHYLFFDFGEGFISAQEAAAARAGTAADWHELSESPEMGAYRAALAKDKQQCRDFEAQLNDISEGRESLAELPWIPGDLKELFNAFLGCDGYPENPHDVYLPPPSSP